MQCSFLSLARNFVTNKRDHLDNDAMMAYMFIGDRMKVSIKNKWIDHRNGQYFIYYGRDQLAHDLRIGRTKTSHILKVFKNMGLIDRAKDPVKHCYRLYMPKFTWRTGQCSKSEHYSNNKSNNNKSHDSEHDNRLKGVEDRKPNTDVKLPKDDDKLDHQEADLASKYKRLPKAVTDTMVHALGGHKLYECIHILTVTSRQHIRNSYKGAQWIKYALDYDANRYFRFKNGQSFASYIDHGLRKAFHAARNMYAYFMGVCKRYYAYAIKWYQENHSFMIKSHDGPDIPIFKI